MATTPSSRSDGKSSIEAATEAIAKVNAMLIAKGKLKPSQLNSHPGGKKTGPQSSLMTTEVEINDVPIGCRNMLTRGSTQEEISKMSGAAVATRGRYMSPEERANNPSERALYLSVQASTKEALDLAVGRINEIIANGIARQGAKMSKFSPAVVRAPIPPQTRGPQPGYIQEPLQPTGPPPLVPQPPVVMPPVQNITLFQEKLIIGLEHAPPNFNVKDKVFGPGGSFLQHIQAETGCKVTLRGKGSGFIEPTGTEALEPMHIHLQHVTNDGLQQAKSLATNLIQTVQQEYAAFQQSFVTVPPPNMLPQPPYLIPPPQIVSIAKPPPMLPGQPIASVSMAQPVPMLQPPPQTNFLTPPPGIPGQVIQTQPVQTYAPPATGGQPVQQFVQSTDQQLLSVPISQPPPMIMSMSSTQQPGQMVITSMGQPHLQTTTVPPIMQQQLPPPGSIQVAQPQQPVAVAQPQPVLQQPGIQQPGFQQQQQQQIGLQQTVLQQQPTMSVQHQIIQQPAQQQVTSQLTTLQTGLQHMPTSIQSGIQQLPPGIQQIQHQQQLPAPTLQQIQQGTIPQQISPAGVPAPQVVSQLPPGYTGTQLHGQAVASQVHVQPAQSPQSMIMSSSQPHASVSTTPACSAPVSATPSSYVYSTGPKEEPKRRFTEIKQEDKLPENLLGYEHGPPHLANLVVQPGQPPQQTIPQQQQQHVQGNAGKMVQLQDNSSLPAQGHQFETGQPQPVYTGQVVATQPVNLGVQQHQTEQQRQEIEDRLQSGTLSPSQGSQSTFTQQQQQPTPNGDKMLMPPPPPPASNGLKRQSPSLSPGPDNKKMKSVQDDDDDVDIPSSIASQVKEFKKYTYNQISNAPQLYQTPDPNPQAFEQVNNMQPVQTGNVPEQNTGIHSSSLPVAPGSQSPAPPQPAGGEPAVMTGYQSDTGSHGQYLQYQSYSQYQPVQQTSSPSPVYIASSQQPQSGYVQTSPAPSFSPYTVQTSQSYIPASSSQQQQQPVYPSPSFLQPPPPPPLVEDTRPGQPQDFQSNKDMMDGRGGHGMNSTFMQYQNRDSRNFIHQPPPPPPPPRSYW